MIEINNLTTVSVDKKFLKKVGKIVLEGESASWRKKEGDLSVALVGQNRIRKLNKKYRKKNRATDVLAFGQNQKSKIKNQKFIEPFLGEVVICQKEVKKNAKKFSQSFEKELAKILIHGILHLLGEDHEKSDKKAEIMEKKQNYYLEKIFKK